MLSRKREFLATYLLLTIGAMLLVRFVVISYEISKQQASMHNAQCTTLNPLITAMHCFYS